MSDLDLVLTRVIGAPRELVWAAWTTPEHLKHWWGPHGMTTPVIEMDLRPGGIFRTVMRDPAGNEYPTNGTFAEIAKPEKLVFDNDFPDGPDGKPGTARCAVRFDAMGAKHTRMTVRWTHTSQAQKEMHLAMGFHGGWGETVDRLVLHVAPQPGGPKKVTLTRRLDAPRALVWQAWTDPKMMTQWWGPKHFTAPHVAIDLRPGGAVNLDMQGPDGTIYPCQGLFRAVVPTEKLVFWAWVPDAEGRAFLDDVTTVTFTEQNGKTLVTVDATVLQAMPEAAASLSGMEEGWAQSLEKLAPVVENPGARPAQ